MTQQDQERTNVTNENKLTAAQYTTPDTDTSNDAATAPAASEDNLVTAHAQDSAAESEVKTAAVGAQADSQDRATAEVTAGADTDAGGKAEVGAEAGKKQFSMGDDVSSFTGRPRITPEENQALSQGARFFHKAMRTAARARGEEYEPYRLPAQMRAALAQIDAEAAQAKIAEAKKAGMSDEEAEAMAHSAIEQLHSMNAEELASMRKKQEDDSSAEAGGARFYSKYKALVENQEQHKEENRVRLARNIKMLFIVILGLVGYMAYNEFLVDKDARSIEELKAALPLTIDAHTAMVRIDDRDDNFKIYFEKDPKAFEGLDEHQKDAALDQFTQNAPLLCKNTLLRSIISSGKKVTVLLEATDRSFLREFSVDRCPTDTAAPSDAADK